MVCDVTGLRAPEGLQIDVKRTHLCKKHLMDALERILSDVSWDHWVFRVSQHHTPSPRWPSRGWSSPNLRPSSSPRISPLNPKPPCGLLCGFARGLNGPLLGRSCNTQTTEDFAKWTSCKASTANFCRLIEGPPASLPALLHQFLARFLSLASSIRSSQGTVSSSMISCFKTSEVTIMSGRRLVVAMCWGNLSCFPRSTCSCQFETLVRRPVIKWGRVRGFSPSLMKEIAFFETWWYLLVLMAESKLSEIAFSTWSWRQR